jgi:hypothetical protein
VSSSNPLVVVHTTQFSNMRLLLTTAWICGSSSTISTPDACAAVRFVGDPNHEARCKGEGDVPVLFGQLHSTGMGSKLTGALCIEAADAAPNSEYSYMGECLSGGNAWRATVAATPEESVECAARVWRDHG